MKNKLIYILLSASILFASSVGIILASGDDERSRKGSWLSSWFDDDDDDEHGEKKRVKNNRGGSPVLASISAAPPEFIAECGSCHMAYQPELLPASSWGVIMAGLDNHFGEDATSDLQTHQQILSHLNRFSAEKSTSRLSRRTIMRSVGNRVYLRISDIPKIRHEHEEEFSKSLLKRKSIRSISNCEACHIPAPQGEYDEDYVRIPR